MLWELPVPNRGRSWLDRLRTSKGFPIPPDLDLDHFLSLTNPSPIPPPHHAPDTITLPDPPLHEPLHPRRSRPPPPPPPADKSTTTAGEGKLFDLMSSVLAELFVMGGPPPPSGALAEVRSSRKQPNPRIHVPSASASAEGSGGCLACGAPAATSPPSAENSVAEAKKGRTKGRKKKRPVAAGTTDSDLSAYSKTEVTVIDTSTPGWKSAKLIFHKGLVWKVRDKKLWNAGKKKRRLGLVQKVIGENGKEEAVINSKVPPPKEHLLPVSEGDGHTNNGDSLDEPEDRNQISERRPIFSGSPYAPDTKNLSILRIKFKTKSKKIGASGSKASLEGR